MGWGDDVVSQERKKAAPSTLSEVKGKKNTNVP